MLLLINFQQLRQDDYVDDDQRVKVTRTIEWNQLTFLLLEEDNSRILLGKIQYYSFKMSLFCMFGIMLKNCSISNCDKLLDDQKISKTFCQSVQIDNKNVGI